MSGIELTRLEKLFERNRQSFYEKVEEIRYEANMTEDEMFEDMKAVCGTDQAEDYLDWLAGIR